MKVHAQCVCQTSFYQLRQLRSVRRSLSVNACTALVHAFVTSRLDYCYSLLAGIGYGLIDQLQTVLRWRLACSSVSASSNQFRLTFVTVSIGFPSVQESTSSWVFSFTSVSMALLLHTSRRCLYRNQLFQPSPVFARQREVIFLCRGQNRKQLGLEALPLLDPPSGTIYLTI